MSHAACRARFVAYDIDATFDAELQTFTNAGQTYFSKQNKIGIVIVVAHSMVVILLL
jgi:hypothetical protein